MISQGSEALPLSIIENETRAHLTEGRTLPVSSPRAVAALPRRHSYGWCADGKACHSSDQAS